jgi:hypothetical protein
VADLEEIQMLLAMIGLKAMDRANDQLVLQTVSKELLLQKHEVRKGNKKVIS